jgi:hypothetical protein
MTPPNLAGIQRSKNSRPRWPTSRLPIWPRRCRYLPSSSRVPACRLTIRASRRTRESRRTRQGSQRTKAKAQRTRSSSRRTVGNDRTIRARSRADKGQQGTEHGLQRGRDHSAPATPGRAATGAPTSEHVQPGPPDGKPIPNEHAKVNSTRKAQDVREGKGGP